MKNFVRPFCLAALIIMSAFLLKAQEIQTYPSQVSEIRLLGKTRPLRDLTPIGPSLDRSLKDKAKRQYPRQIPNFAGNTPMPANNVDALPKGADPLRQAGFEKNTIPIIPQLVFDGMDEQDSGVTPPDPVGDVGPNHYVQMINGSNGAIFQIWDKEGNSLYGPASCNTFWQPFGITGLGDPIVLYDEQADRWLLTEFGTFGTNVMLVAVSETGDPLGSYFAYEFQAPSFPDYPKYAVWHDAYYVTTNEPGDPNIPVYVLDRAAMLSGAPTAGLQRLGIPKFSAPNAFQAATPVEWDGSAPPPPGSPHYLVRIYDDAWDGGFDKLELWEVHTDWNNPNNSSVSGPINIPLAPFDAEICDNGDIFNCLQQPTGVLISGLQQIIMFRAPYRNFGPHESILLNFSVDINGQNQSGIRWVELRKSGGGDWSLYQEGTFAPDDNSRFMGSLAQDAQGNILLGYSITGPNTFLSLRYTGRLASDPLGEMTIDEYEFAPGNGIQFASRWGDYACMTVDPVDQRTFWFTGEYQNENLWATSIAKVLVQRDSNDVGVAGLLAPQNSGYLTDSETVIAQVRNYGYNPQSGIGIHYSVNGGPVVSEMIADTIQPLEPYDHTFSTTVDMEAIGTYGFLIFTTLDADTVFFNDTLRTFVTQLTRNDAAIGGFNGISIPVCDTVAAVDILILNAGVDTLTSANIYFELNGAPPALIEWTGALPPGQTEPVSVILDEVVQGNNTITAFTELPNGVPDENPLNDKASRTFVVLGDGIDVTLELMTDDYPFETTWELRDLDGNLLYSGGPYSQPATLFTESFCLEDECYVFTIFDTFGDGMLGFSTNGYYRLTNEDGIVVAAIQQINFGSSEVNEFCANGDCGLLASGFITPESEPGAQNGRILVTGNGGISPYQYSIDGGETFQSQSLFSNLSGGDYQVAVKDAYNCTGSTTVTVPTCTLLLAAETQNASGSASNDGSITAIITGGVPPFQYRIMGGAFQDEPTISGLTPGNYTLIIRDSVGCSRQLDVTVNFTVSADDNFFGKQIQVFPNPTEGYLQLSVRGLPGLSVLPISIYDASGRLVKWEKLVAYDDSLTKRISLHELPSGTYFIRFMHEELPELVKVVKE